MYMRVAESLNRNILECKFVVCVDVINYVSCLNRNILECKCEGQIQNYRVCKGLNRNILECKCCLLSVR